MVSAASGAMGQLVGQIAKLAGCRAVAMRSASALQIVPPDQTRCVGAGSVVLEQGKNARRISYLLGSSQGVGASNSLVAHGLIAQSIPS